MSSLLSRSAEAWFPFLAKTAGSPLWDVAELGTYLGFRIGALAGIDDSRGTFLRVLVCTPLHLGALAAYLASR